MKNIINMILFVLILGTLLTLTLVTVNYLTEDKITKNAEISLKKSVLNALDIPYTRQDLEAVFTARIKEVSRKQTVFYIAGNGNIAWQFSGSGLWGPIVGVIALAPDGETVKGISFIHQEETPGLGSRITEKGYLASYIDKRFAPKLALKGSPAATPETEVDSITGATLSSNALVNILNLNYEEKISMLKEISNGG